MIARSLTCSGGCGRVGLLWLDVRTVELAASGPGADAGQRVDWTVTAAARGRRAAPRLWCPACVREASEDAARDRTPSRPVRTL